MRYSALVHDADVALYYYNGYDPSPAFKLTAEAIGVPDASAASPLHVRDLSGATTLSPAFERIQSGGADAAYALDNFTLRVEAAFVHGRPFARDLRTLIDDPSQLAPELTNALRHLAAGDGRFPVSLPDSFVTRNATEWAVGCDSTFNGYWVLLQLNQTDVLNNHVNLLIKDAETRILLNFRKSFLEDRVTLRFVGIHSIESDYTTVRSRLTYRLTDEVSIEGGYLLVAGRSASLIGQYGDNDEAWIGFNIKL
ncbi:MAG: hypothetical protein HY270_08325 [Deltaproteobacteria bacterium]|nr:hypothetical protein [Deltaproteobacteria bacterium]